MKKHLLIALVVMPCLLVSAQYIWVSKNPFPDSSFSHGASFVINDMGYVIGGQLSDTPTESNHVWQYNPVSDAWVQKGNYPYKAMGGASFVINDTGYQVGGYDTANLYSSGNYAYNAGSDTWSQKSPFPEDGYAAGYYFVINGIAYVGGGERSTNEHGVVTGYAYNPATDSWSSIADFPYPAIGLCTFVIDSIGYAGTGGDGNGNFFNSMYKYSPTANTWTAIAPYPGKGRFADHGSFVVGGKGYVGAGETVSTNGGAYSLGDYYAYDPVADAWSFVPGVPGPPRHAPDAFSFGDSAYLVGGYNQDGPVYYNFVDEFRLTQTVCRTTDTLYITVNTGIPPNNTATTLSVYPNPAHNQLLINTGNYANMAGYSIKITTPLGQTVFQNADNQQLFTIGITTWATGVYVLQVLDPSNAVAGTKEIVIQ